LVKNELIEQL